MPSWPENVAGRRRTRRLAAALAGALAVVLVAASLALVQRERADERALAAERATLVADANRLAATAGTATDLDLSLLLATEAVRTADTPETQDGLLAALVEHRQAVSVFRTPSGMRPDVPAVAGDGRQLHLLTEASTAGISSALLSWDLSEGAGAPRLSTVHVDPYAMAASPVDGRVATLHSDGALTIDGHRGPPVQLAYPSLGGVPFQVGWSPDGRVLVVLVDPGRGPHRRASGRLQVLRLDARSGAVLSRTRPVAGDSGQVSTDGRTVLMWAEESDSPPMLVDAELGRVRPLSRTSAQAEGDRPRLFGSMVAWLGSNGGITLSDRTSGRVRQRVVGHTSRVVSLRLSPDQRTAVSVGDDRRVVVWDVGPGLRLELREVLAGHGGSVVDVAFSPDSARAYSASLDGTVIGWDLEDRLRFGTPTATVPGRWISRRPVMAQGRWVAPTERLRDGRDAYEALDVSLAFVDPRTGRTEATVGVGQADPITAYGSSVAVSPDGERLVATAGTDIVVLDARSGQRTGRITLARPDAVSDAVWSRDGRSILVGARGLRVRQGARGRGRGRRGRPDAAPDGSHRDDVRRPESRDLAGRPARRRGTRASQVREHRRAAVGTHPTRDPAGRSRTVGSTWSTSRPTAPGSPPETSTVCCTSSTSAPGSGSASRRDCTPVSSWMRDGWTTPRSRPRAATGGSCCTTSGAGSCVANRFPSPATGERTAATWSRRRVTSSSSRAPGPPDAASPCRCRAGWRTPARSPAADLTAAEWASYVPSRPYRQTCG